MLPRSRPSRSSWQAPCQRDRRIAISLAPALFDRNGRAAPRAERLDPWTLPPAAPPFVHIASRDEGLNARRAHGLYIGTEVTDGIAGILRLSVLRVGQPFVRLRRFGGSDDVPTRFFQEDFVNVDAICGGSMQGFWHFIAVEECSPDERILFRLRNADFELPRDSDHPALAINTPTLGFVKNAGLHQPRLLPHGATTSECLDELLVVQERNRAEALAKQRLYFVETRKEGAGIDRKSTRLNSSHVSISYAVF